MAYQTEASYLAILSKDVAGDKRLSPSARVIYGFYLNEKNCGRDMEDSDMEEVIKAGFHVTRAKAVKIMGELQSAGLIE